MRTGAFPVDVETTAVEFGSLVGNVVLGVAAGVHEGFPESCRLVGLDAFPPHVPVKQSAGPESHVADDLRIEAVTWSPGIPEVLGVLEDSRSLR